MLEKLRKQKSWNSIKRVLRDNGIGFEQPCESIIRFRYDGAKYSLQRRTNPIRILIEKW